MRIALESCRLQGVDTAVRCGTYEVWEDREGKAGRRIKINIAVIPARVCPASPIPIFVAFAGGPGQGAVALAAQAQSIFSRLNDTRDIVLVDQRGTGHSHPLDCGKGEQPIQAMFEDALPEKLVERCLENLDADPRQYVTTIAVADIDEVREGLGYERINLWGASYGTRFALEYLRRYGSHVRSVILDGVAPASMKLPLSFVVDGEAALKKLIDACVATRTACRRTYPDLRESIDSMKARLADRSERATILDPRTGESASISVTQNVFLAGLFRPLYVAELASLLPYGVAAAAQGDFNPLLAQNMALVSNVSENLAVGLHLR